MIWKILNLFLNTLSAISKYSLLKRYNITQPIRMQLSQKQKPFSEWFSAYFKSSLNFEHFEKKKKWRWHLIHFLADGLRKTWLDQCLKSPALEHPWKSKMVNGFLHCWNLNDSTCTIFIDQWERNWVSESLFYWYPKS